jgi:recombination endonuclease VII
MPRKTGPRDADNARRRERRAQDPEYRARHNARNRAYYQEHREELIERFRQYRETHAHECSARQRVYRQAHKERISARNRAYKRDNESTLRAAGLRWRYGISQEEYDALLAKQGGVCAICRRHSKRRLCVDHCHITGMIRGLLCRLCNIALGCLKEDQASFAAALAYLGALPRDGPGSAAERALLVRLALPPGRRGKAILKEVTLPVRPVQRAAGAS